MPTRENKKDTKDFLLSEYELLREMRDRVISRGEERIRFYFSLLSGAAALIALISQVFGTGESFYVVILIVSSALLIFGILTLDRLVSGHIAARVYARGANRIRRYFVDKDKSISNYLILPITDDVPEFGIVGYAEKKGSGTGNVSIMIYIDSILVAIIGFVIVAQFLEVQLVYSAIAAILIAFVSIYIHSLYYNRQMKLASKKIEIKFPKKP